MSTNEMRVVKRNGTMETLYFDKIFNRIKTVDNMEIPVSTMKNETNTNTDTCNALPKSFNYSSITQTVIKQLYDGIETSKIDELVAEQCESQSSQHYAFSRLASRIIISNNHKRTCAVFSEAVKLLYLNGFKSEKEEKSNEKKEEKANEEKDEKSNEEKDEKSNETNEEKEGKKKEKEKANEDKEGKEKANEDKENDEEEEKANEEEEKAKEAKEMKQRKKPLICDWFFMFVVHFARELDAMIVSERDYLIDYFGYKTLERAYLFSIENKIIERPQFMWMRVAVGIHYHRYFDESNLWPVPEVTAEILKDIQETYDLMSLKYYTHATPTLFNAGTPTSQLSSCYLVGMEEDSIEGIYGTLQKCAMISKHSGGIGLHIHDIRAKGSRIYGTNGVSNGIVPMLRVFNNTAKYVDQGGNKRKGSIAIYLEPWHADIEDFLEMKKNHGDEESRARDLFYALWVSDVFMQRVNDDKQWSLFCPTVVGNLADLYGPAFQLKYERLERTTKPNKVVWARELFKKILDAQMETGTPYLLFKDAVNAKSNQQNLGTIRSSNLCCEVMQFSNKDETAVCNLASIGLPSFVHPETKEFDYAKLHAVTKVITKNLNHVIDINFYPVKSARNSNMRHRPIGIGVQGLADTFVLMDVAFLSPQAEEINRQIFETIYHAALEQSCELSKLRTLRGEIGPYSSFAGSPASQGVLQFDLWTTELNPVPKHSGRYDWDALKQLIRTHGLRNSLLLAPMPTASTSQILGFNECFEPFTSNLYSRRTLAGEFVVVNKYLMKELLALGEWDENVKNNIIANKGSIQQLTHLPQHIRDKYKIVWEIPMKHIINMAADRGIYICQSQSMNLWMESPTYQKLYSMHFYSWKKGLKTGIYYLRTKPKHQAQQFTIEPVVATNHTSATFIEDDNGAGICDVCSS